MHGLERAVQNRRGGCLYIIIAIVNDGRDLVGPVEQGLAAVTGPVGADGLRAGGHEREHDLRAVFVAGRVGPWTTVPTGNADNAA